MELFREALNRFKTQHRLYCEADVVEPAAVTLSTAGRDKRPSSRTVLLKEVDERGFMFVTNTRSRKGRQIAENPYAAMCFYWPALGEQVNIEGNVAPLSEAEAERYWKTRPRESQVGAWASLQSEPLNARDTLLRRFKEYEEKFHGRDIPRPTHWSGYRLAPVRIEFWKSQPHRLHERTVYFLDDGVWKVEYLYP